MRVRIQFGKESPAAERRRPVNPGLATALGALLTPAAVAASILGMWRIAADLGWASDFAISSGFFSHWQVWMAGAIALEICARLLHRYARRHAMVEEAAGGVPAARSRAV